MKQFLANRIQTLQALFVWSIWALMLLAAMVAVWVKGSPFPKGDDWEMIPALTGHQADMLPWLWSQHGFYQDGQIIEGQINEHRNALGRVIILGLLSSTNGDFRSGMMFSALGACPRIGLVRFFDGSWPKASCLPMILARGLVRPRRTIAAETGHEHAAEDLSPMEPRRLPPPGPHPRRQTP